jgi:hypothetical protein
MAEVRAPNDALMRRVVHDGKVLTGAQVACGVSFTGAILLPRERGAKPLALEPPCGKSFPYPVDGMISDLFIAWATKKPILVKQLCESPLRNRAV